MRGCDLLALAAYASLLLLALSGCATTSGARVGSTSPSPAATSAIAVASPSPLSTAIPALCSAARPARQTPFPVNRDAAARAALMAGTAPTVGPTGDIGGAEQFEGMTVQRFAEVLSQKFMDPNQGIVFPFEPVGPSHWDFFQFLCKHPSATVSGYMISSWRPDYGMFIDLIQLNVADGVPVSEQRQICRGAPTTTFGPLMYCWWNEA